MRVTFVQRRARHCLGMMVTCSDLCRGGGAGDDECWVYQWTSDNAGMARADGGRRVQSEDGTAGGKQEVNIMSF